MKSSQILNKDIETFDSDELDCQIIILAAGKGSRMDSDLPKVMHKLGGKPMLERVLDNSREVSDDVILVYSTILLEHLLPYQHLCKFALQDNPKGTAHAADAAKQYFNHHKNIMVVYGDNPLITSKIMTEFINHQHSTKAAVITLAFNREEPGQYGRIVTDDNGKFLKIIEYKDANEAEKKIKLCNSGIMIFAPGILEKYLPHCLNNYDLQNELYLTKMVEVCVNSGEKVEYFLSNNANLVIGVNTQAELEEASTILKNQLTD